MKYRFSIVIVAKNEGSFLERTVKSITTDKYDKSYEIILVDDDSNDSSFDFTHKWNYSIPLRVIKGQNLGVAKSRNRGAEKARGEYLLFLDAHMIIDKGFLTKVDHTLNTHTIDILGVRCNRFTDPSHYFTKRLPVYTNRDITMFMNDWVYRRAYPPLLRVPFIIGACMIVKRTTFENIGGFFNFIERWGPEDRTFCLEAYLQGYGVYCDSTITVRHRFKKPIENRELWFSLLYNSLACGFVLYDDAGFQELLHHFHKQGLQIKKHPMYWLYLKNKKKLEKFKKELEKKRKRPYRDFVAEYSEYL